MFFWEQWTSTHSDLIQKGRDFSDGIIVMAWKLPGEPESEAGRAQDLTQPL